MEPSDEELCQRVAGRDEAAFDLLVVRYQERTYRLAWSILGDAEEARDLSQEAFLRLLDVAGSFGGRARFSTWFFRILVNLCLDHRRKNRWWSRLFDPRAGEDLDRALERQPSSLPDPSEEAAKKSTMKKLWSAVDRLSPRQRTALLLQVKEDLKASEIAGVLDCSEATVRVHLHRAVKQLRRVMEET